MIVISDATPIIHLARAGYIWILPEMLGKVIIPFAVFRELQADETPEVVLAIVRSMPEWLAVKEASAIVDHELDPLDQGEREAIILAEELNADLLLMDEKKGRMVALERRIAIVGTLGLLERAAIRGLLDFRIALAALKATEFYVGRDLEADFLKRFPDNK